MKKLSRSCSVGRQVFGCVFGIGNRIRRYTRRQIGHHPHIRESLRSFPKIAAIVGGIYHLIDMGSTTLDCMGDMVGPVIVAHSEEKTKGNTNRNS